jgi:hypothetical protein
MRKNRNKAEMLISYIDNARFKKCFFTCVSKGNASNLMGQMKVMWVACVHSLEVNK